MSDSVNTNTLAFYRGKDRPYGVSVSPGSVTAGPAPENSFRQWESLLGSRKTTRTRHRCIGGRHNHHRPARPRSGSDQFTFRRTDSVVGSFTRHRGLEQKLGTEILHSDQPIRCRLRVSRGFQIKLRLGSSGNAGNTPVDTRRTVHLAQRGIVDADHETSVPVAQRVLKHSNAGWFAGQLARPHHRDQPAASQPQATVFETEPVTGVLQTRQSLLRVLEISSALTRERAQRLLLRGHRTLTQHPPLHHGSGPKPVVVPQHRGRGHHTNIFDGSDISGRRHMHQATTNGHPYLPTSEARGISGGSR